MKRSRVFGLSMGLVVATAGLAFACSSHGTRAGASVNDTFGDRSDVTVTSAGQGGGVAADADGTSTFGNDRYFVTVTLPNGEQYTAETYASEWDRETDGGLAVEEELISDIMEEVAAVDAYEALRAWFMNFVPPPIRGKNFNG